MGRRGSWFSAIKRVFSPHSKEKPANDLEKKSKKDKKGAGKLRHGETNSFIPLFREPSSVEKIFLDYEREQQRAACRPQTPPDPPRTPSLVLPRPTSPRIPSLVLPRPASPRIPSPRATSPRGVSLRASPPRAASSRITHRHRERPEPTLRNHHASATKIQAAYRGYLARKSFRALKGLVRLQGVVRGQNVKRQTMNAMKQMQLLVRVQAQIQSRRIQLLEHQPHHPNHKVTPDSALGKFSFGHASEAGNNEDWDDSVLTQEEVDARLQRKLDAVIKRERAMAYAHSNQSLKAATKSAQAPVSDLRSTGYPWWWNWLERQHPPPNSSQPQTLKNFLLAPPTPQYEQNPTPRFKPNDRKQRPFGIESMDDTTPKSTRSAIFASSKASRTPPIANRTPPANGSGFGRFSRPKASGAESLCDTPLKDDDSLTSCPPFSVPHYMASTASAQSRARASSNPKERFPATPTSESHRRQSFPLTQGISSPFKWNKGSLFSGKESSSQRISDQKQSLQSIDNISVDSTLSLPTGVGRKPFNRFV